MQYIAEDLRVFEEKDDIRKLSEETEALLKFGSWTLFIDSGRMLWTPGLYLVLEHDRHTNEPLTLNDYLSHIVTGFRDSFEELLRQAVTSGEGFDLEYMMETSAGKCKIVSTKARVVAGDNGGVEKVQGITRDITSLRKFEEEQEKFIRDLNRSNKELEEFAYVASHDLQEPLRKITMFGERLEHNAGDVLDQEGKFFLSRIINSSKNMKTLIDDLLAFSSLHRASSDSLQTMNLCDVLDQAKFDLELKIAETGTVIKVESGLPKIEGVSTTLKQLFSNLFSNAIKFRKSGEPGLINISCVRLSKEEKRSNHLSLSRVYYKISVADRGIGFEQEHAENIFQIFRRLHGKSEYPGTGIGLAICKKIVDNHNGLIFAHSVPGEGATFTIILPEKQ
jgi:signal transduction histidine kinase